MAQHRSSRSPDGVATSARHRRIGPEAAEITDIIPFNELGDLADLDFRENSAFDRESQVIHAPELDDLHDTDDLIPQRLAVPSEFRPDPREERRASHAYRDSHTDTSNGVTATDVIDISGRRGLHRKQEVPVKGRLMVAAMAVGAIAAGAYSMANASDKAPAETVLAADQSVMGGGVVTGSVDGMQIVSVAPAANASWHAEEITKAAAFAQERADREARLKRPLFVMPTKGVWTSGFGYRWGVLHGGIDIANSIGTPIVGRRRRRRHRRWARRPATAHGSSCAMPTARSRCTATSTPGWSSIGQRVMAGDQIATIGNRGNSTGPHLHFEVLLNGTNRIDPVPWLAQRGLSPRQLRRLM